MRIEVQTTPEFVELAGLLEHISVAMLTTEDADHALISRPMSPLEMDAQGAIWFFTDLRSSKVAQLENVNLSFADVERATYVSLSGHGEVFANPTRAEVLWTELARPWFPDGPESAHLALLKFVVDVADYWHAPSIKMVRVLTMVMTADGGERVALSEPPRLIDSKPPLEQPTATF